MELIFGPLALSECRRLLSRGWPFVVRTLAGLTAAGVVLVVGWAWWFLPVFDPTFRPGTLFRDSLTILEGLTITAALILSPAMLAGIIAGEKDSGTLELLLTSRLASREIVLARLLSRLSQIGVIMLAVVPALVMLAALNGIGSVGLIALLALPLAVALGGGGMALAASTLCRRGRDALMAVYLLDLVFILAPFVGVQAVGTGFWRWLGPLNPYEGLTPLAWHGDPGPALASTALWTAMGLIGVSVAVWQLRPAYLRQTAGASARARSRPRFWGRIRAGVPPVGDRPMLWKELHIERTRTLGRFGRWIGGLLILYLAGGTAVWAGLITWHRWVEPNHNEAIWATSALEGWITYSATAVSWLLQWAIGLRAAVSIASERQRGTWDALLASPLEGHEIVPAKLWGSLYALRALLAATLLAWTTALLLGAMQPSHYLSQLADLAAVGFFMAAVGVRVSLSARTATRAMTATIGFWLLAEVAIGAAAGLVILIGGLLYLAGWSLAMRMGFTTMDSLGIFPISVETLIWAAWVITRILLYVLNAVSVSAYTRLRFDRLAGRGVPLGLLRAVGSSSTRRIA